MSGDTPSFQDLVVAKNSDLFAEALANYEAERPFKAAVADLGVSFERNERGDYTDSHTACLWRVWCAALQFAKPANDDLYAATKRLLDECNDDGITVQAVTRAREAMAQAKSLLGGSRS